MQERRNKHIFPDLIFSKFFVIICLFVFIFILFGLVKGALRSHNVSAEVVQLQTEINRLKNQNQDFEQLVKYLNTDTFIEQEAKLKLGLKKENENLIIIPDSEIPTKGDIAANVKDKSNLEKWWAYFFN
jgi:cell division protein FtsB